MWQNASRNTEQNVIKQTEVCYVIHYLIHASVKTIKCRVYLTKSLILSHEIYRLKWTTDMVVLKVKHVVLMDRHIFVIFKTKLPSFNH